jgi:hypothetical protein
MGTRELDRRVGVMTRLLARQQRNWGSIPVRSKDIFSCPVSKLALGPIQQSIQRVLGFFPEKVKGLRCEAHHSTSFMSKLRMRGTVPSLPHKVSFQLNTN